VLSNLIAVLVTYICSATIFNLPPKVVKEINFDIFSDRFNDHKINNINTKGKATGNSNSKALMEDIVGRSELSGIIELNTEDFDGSSIACSGGVVKLRENYDYKVIALLEVYSYQFNSNEVNHNVNFKYGFYSFQEEELEKMKRNRRQRERVNSIQQKKSIDSSRDAHSISSSTSTRDSDTECKLPRQSREHKGYTSDSLCEEEIIIDNSNNQKYNDQTEKENNDNTYEYSDSIDDKEFYKQEVKPSMRAADLLLLVDYYMSYIPIASTISNKFVEIIYPLIDSDSPEYILEQPNDIACEYLKETSKELFSVQKVFYGKKHKYATSAISTKDYYFQKDILLKDFNINYVDVKRKTKTFNSRYYQDVYKRYNYVTYDKHRVDYIKIEIGERLYVKSFKLVFKPVHSYIGRILKKARIPLLISIYCSWCTGGFLVLLYLRCYYFQNK